jgi:acyl-coenzyme A synthetase/AMP-(fatty) acid ligase
VAGHRLGTKEIEEAIGHHPEVAESAVVGIHGQALKIRLQARPVEGAIFFTCPGKVQCQ